MLTSIFAKRNQHFGTLRRFVMSAEKPRLHSPRKKYDEQTSIRSQKRKRALGHYENRNKGEKFELDDELTNETTYYIENGLRKVYPYYFHFKTFVKGRWIGRTLLDVYTNEFKQAADDHLEAISSGSITVNGKPATPDTVLKDGMMLAHKCHRHEMPVLADPIEVIADTPDILVINKPSSIPVHPCGRYRYNSLTFLLRHQFGYNNLRTLYRLDRLTSGVLIMPKTTSVSKKMEAQLQKREFEKEYICRVVGRFPDAEVVCTEPLGCMSHKLSIYKVDPEGKESKTTFTRLSYNGRTSVVKCIPHTGRTHQIRLHLQFLGYPICNDPLYNSDAFGPSKGKTGVIENTLEQIEKIYMESSNVGRWIIGENPKYFEKFGKSSGKSKDLATHTTMTDGEDLSDSGSSKNAGNTSEVTGKMDSDEGKDVPQVETTQQSEENWADLKDQSDNCNVEGPLVQKLELCHESDRPLKKLKSDRDTSTSEGQETLHIDDLPEGSVEVGNSQETEQCTDVVNRVEDNSDKEAGRSHTSESVDNVEVRDSSKPLVINNMAASVTDPEFVESKLILDEQCEDCKHLFQDPDRSELILYLHAVTYRGPGWEYSSSLPYWATEDFDERTDHTPHMS